jgi:Domain of unknown function (DUF4124)
MKLASLLCSLLFLDITIAHADLYQWTDAQGVTHVVDDTGLIPDAYRDRVKTHHTAKPTNSQISLLAPSRTYPENSQGVFAQKLAFDLGLIKNSGEDALGPLGTAGIQPAGGWQVYDPLTPETQADVIAAARRAANSQRVRMSADGAEAIVRQAATAFLPPPPIAQIQAPPADAYEEEAFDDQGPEIIVEQQPPEIIEVIREPVYIPQPVIVGVPPRHGHRGKRLERSRRAPQENTAQQSSIFSTPAPTHMPFGASHMPFGTSSMPFGSNHGARGR